MFKFKRRENTESMASLPILGGFIPLCGFLVAHSSLNFPHADLYAAASILLVTEMVIGCLSLLVMRSTKAWRILVAIGSIAFVAIALIGVMISAWLTAISLLLTTLMAIQYRVDLKRSKIKDQA